MKFIIQKRKSKLINFLFPLWPIKVFNSIHSIAILSILIGIRIVLQYTSFVIPSINMSISIAWTPIIIVGWTYGPIFGFVLGAITDTISFLISPSVWFWMYAIQEPLVGFLSGVFAYVCLSRKKSYKKNSNKSLKIDLLVTELLILIFFAICFLGLYSLHVGVKFQGQSSNIESFFIMNSKWVILGSMLFFFVVIQITIFIFLKRTTYFRINLFWIIINITFFSLLFSFLLGPITANEYYKYLYGSDSPNFVKYGLIFYLIPRTLKESFKAPIQILILCATIPLALNSIQEMKKNINNKWIKKYK